MPDSRPPDGEAQTGGTTTGLSLLWDVCLPLALTAFPASIWMLLGWVIAGLDRPNAPVAEWRISVMLIMQTVGICALAVVALMRRDLAHESLRRSFPNGPPEWRRALLNLAVVCLTLFDLIANLAVALPDASFLLLIAIPMYAAYLLLIRLSFWGVVKRTS